MTDRRDEERERREDERRREESERRHSELKESWRRNHPSKPEEGRKGRPKRGGAA